MTCKEIIRALSEWPDDAQVEISIIPGKFDEELSWWREKSDDEPVWLSIKGVEKPVHSTHHTNENSHCLIFADKVTMS